jgi:hypothetical protein
MLANPTYLIFAYSPESNMVYVDDMSVLQNEIVIGSIFLNISVTSNYQGYFKFINNELLYYSTSTYKVDIQNGAIVETDYVSIDPAVMKLYCCFIENSIYIYDNSTAIKYYPDYRVDEYNSISIPGDTFMIQGIAKYRNAVYALKRDASL